MMRVQPMIRVMRCTVRREEIEMQMRYLIENTRSGVELGVFDGADEAQALDAMARVLGYADYAECCEVSPVRTDGEISVSPVACLDGIEVSAGRGRADSELYMRPEGESEWRATPYRFADAGMNWERAARLVSEWADYQS